MSAPAREEAAHGPWLDSRNQARRLPHRGTPRYRSRAPRHPQRLRVGVQNGKRPGIRDRRRFICPTLATFAQSPPGPAGPVTASPRSGWSIIEDKSATGKSAQFSAGIIVGDTALILRCRDQRTEAAFSTEDTDLGEESVKVRYRIDLNEPIQQASRPV